MDNYNKVKVITEASNSFFKRWKISNLDLDWWGTELAIEINKIRLRD